MPQGAVQEEREGRGTSLSSVDTHRIAPHPTPPRGFRRSSELPAFCPSGGGLKESLAHLFKAAAATTSTSRCAPRVPMPRLPRPRSFQSVTNRWAISAEVPTPSVCFVQSEPICRGKHASVVPDPRAAVQLQGGSRPNCARLLIGVCSGPQRRLPTHARCQPQAQSEWKATPPVRASAQPGSLGLRPFTAGFGIP